MNGPPDAGLVVAHQSGCPRAFAELYVRHYARLVRFCRARVGNAATAEDIVQEAFAQALAGMDRLQGERRFYPWVRVIAWRLVMEHYRRARLTREVAEREAGEPAVVGASPEQLFVRRVAIAQVRQALARLPERQRQVLILREFDELSYAEIADKLGVADTAIPALLHRARTALAREYLAVTWAERLNTLSAWMSLALFGWRRRLARWSGYMPDASALTVPGVTAVLAAGSILGALGGAPALDRHEVGLAFDQSTHSAQDLATRATVSTGPADSAPQTRSGAERGPTIAPGIGSMTLGPRVSNAGNFERGVASVNRGERAYSDRDRARQQPYYGEVGPFYWSADPNQPIRDAQAIVEAVP